MRGVVAFVAALAFAGAAFAQGGVVRGTVELAENGKPQKDRSGVVVYVTGFTDAAPGEIAQLRQKKQTFIPRLLPVVKGQTVSFPNEDRIYHNVFSVSPLATFDLGQYKGKEPPRDVTFEKPGLVPVYCNIHPQMLSYVAVLENDAFALTTKDGTFEIGGIPAGDLVLNAWTPGAPRVSQPLVVAPGQTVEVQLRVDQSERIEPHKRKDGSDYPEEAYIAPPDP